MRRVVTALAASTLVAACAGGGEVTFETRAASLGGQHASIAGAAPAPEGALVTGGLLPTGNAPGASGRTGPGAAATGGTSSATPAGAKGVVKLGTVLPLQGAQRDYGEPILRTTQAFIDEVNARGGVNGWTLQLIAYNACLVCQDEALQATKRLVEQDQVFALVNPYVMVVAFQSVIPYLVSKGVPLMQGGAENQTSDALSPINFATAPPGLFYGRFLPVMVRRYANVRRIGITYLNVPAERDGLDILKREMAKEGIEVVREEPVEAAEEAVTNMDAVVTRMRAAGAEGAVATNPVLIVFGRLAAARQNWQGQWVGPAAWSRLVEESCSATCDDVVLTATAGLSYTDRPTPQMRQYLDTMARRYPGADTTGHTLAAWVGMQLTAEILAKSGPDRKAFIAELERTRGLDLGTTSPLTFTPDRHLGGTQSVLLRLRGGRYVKASDPLSFGEASA